MKKWVRSKCSKLSSLSDDSDNTFFIVKSVNILSVELWVNQKWTVSKVIFPPAVPFLLAISNVIPLKRCWAGPMIDFTVTCSKWLSRTFDTPFIAKNCLRQSTPSKNPHYIKDNVFPNVNCHSSYKHHRKLSHNETLGKSELFYNYLYYLWQRVNVLNVNSIIRLDFYELCLADDGLRFDGICPAAAGQQLDQSLLFLSIQLTTRHGSPETFGLPNARQWKTSFCLRRSQRIKHIRISYRPVVNMPQRIEK